MTLNEKARHLLQDSKTTLPIWTVLQTSSGSLSIKEVVERFNKGEEIQVLKNKNRNLK